LYKIGLLLSLVLTYNVCAQTVELAVELEEISKKSINNINYISLLNQKLNGYEARAPKIFKKYVDVALNNALKINYQKGIAESYLNLGKYFYYQGKLSTAHQYYLQSLKTFEILQLDSGMAVAYNGIGDVYRKEKNYKESIYFYGLCLAKSKTLGDTMLIANTLNDLGDVHRSKKEFLEALQSYTESLSLNRKIKNQVGIGRDHNNLGDIQYQQSNFEKAEEEYKIAIEIFLKLDYPLDISENLISLASIYKKKANYNESLKILDSAVVICQKYGFNEELIKAYDQISELYLLLKRNDKSLEYKTLHNNLREDFYNMQTMAQSNELQEIYESDKKDKEILQQKALLHSNEIKIYSISAVLFLIACLATLFYRYLLAQKKNNKLLANTNEEIKRFNEHLEQKVEDRTKTLTVKNRQLERFVFYHSHIVRAPISRITGLLYLIKKDPEDSPYSTEIYLQMISESIDDIQKRLDEVDKIIDSLDAKI